MNLSPTYEQEYGRKPSETVIRMAEHIEKVGKMLWEQGATDAQEGKKPRHREAHETLVRYAFQLGTDQSPDFVEAIAELWQSDCMEGYSTGKEVHSA